MTILTFIRRCRQFGFCIGQVRELATLVRDAGSSCSHARDLAQAHILTIRAKLTEFEALERDLTLFVASCNSTCAGGPGPACVVLEELSRLRGRLPQKLTCCSGDVAPDQTPEANYSLAEWLEADETKHAFHVAGRTN